MVSYITTTLVLVVLSMLCASAQGCTDDWDHIIYVDHSATDTPTCGNITHRCSTFNTALNKLTHNSIAICLYPGTYNLTNGSHTQLLYKSNIAIIGNSEDTVTIQCSPLSGLSFYRSSNITLKSLTLRKCGSEKFSISRLLGMIRFQVSVYMLYCENVLMDTVTIESSNGTGLTLYNTVGTVTIQHCMFKYNGVLLDKSSIGGGGLQIKFTYCTPWPDVLIYSKLNCKESDPYYSSNAQYNITSSVFTGNTATYMYALSSDINVLLGRGGGVSITLEGHAFNNVFNLLDINITNNTAQQGGGIYLSLHDGAQNSNIIFNNINILNNIANANIDDKVVEGGGAILIELKGFFVSTNNILISKIMIEHNKAIVGGGILLLADSNFVDKNSIVISNSTFHHNSAQHGAAMYLYSFIDPLALYVLISDTNFAKNVVEKISSLLACSGIICTDKLSFTFTGTIMLTSNNGSAIEIHRASLVLDNNSYCIFDNNTGDRGGTIALYDCSTIVLHDNVQLLFNNNSASIGGAIYSGECSLPVCFIQYYQAHVNPEEWNVQVYFSDNTASTYGNAMYISNVVSCWPQNVTCSSIIDNVEIINQTFCWNNTWHYSPGDCYYNVNTSILYYTSPTSFSVYPGGELHLGIEFYDGQMQASNEPLKLCTKFNGIFYSYRGCREIKSNDVFNIYFDRYDYLCISDIKIRLNITFSSIAQCNRSSGTLIDFTSESCPSGANGPFCSSRVEPYYYYPQECYDCPQDLVPVNSTSCLKGSGISSEYILYALCVGCNYTCSDHDDIHVGWYIIILVEFIPLTIMMLSIIVLDIKLVGGHITGYILYCQIVSLPFAAILNPGQHYTEPLMSLWNLNFVNPFMSFKFCISNHASGLEVIIFWYIVAFYPLVLLLLLYIWIIMYERGWRMVVCITRPVHRLLARFWLKFDIHPSLIDSIAGIYILCFTQLAATSFKLLHSSHNGTKFYYDESLAYFGWRHGLAGSFAIIVLIVFVIIPTVYLLFYPFKLFQKFLEVCKLRTQLTDAVIDSLTGSFKNGLENTYDYRSFAGLYLLLRIIIICLQFIHVDSCYGLPTSLLTAAGLFILVGGAIVIFRPFRRNVHNFSNFVFIFLFLSAYEIFLAIFDSSYYGYMYYSSSYYYPCTLSGPHSIYYISATIMLVLIVIGYCTYIIIKKSRLACGFKMKKLSANDDEQSMLQQSNISSSLNDGFNADRMANPDSYEERHFSNAWLESHISDKQSSNTTPSDDIPLDQIIADDHSGNDVDEGGGANVIEEEEDMSAPYRLWSETEEIISK